MDDVADVVGISSQRLKVHEYRWLAPEVSTRELSTKSDVYSFAMTVLEVIIFCLTHATVANNTSARQLMTNEHPYSDKKNDRDLIKVLSTQPLEKPERPTSSEVIERGLDEKLWSLLLLCWDQDPEKRPSIKDVLKYLP